ncbi:hypothetical protein BTA51_11450 [Hahella sp. CCB-MM4]|uniref:ATP-binding protein n=1 Tax=Hahella sp. (strain CCB-MM4) TaxID=1926491 RepID=UPI000B9B51B8|nr:ATP-binding protein [Hahella sp. CCB-MM4]OZG73105.1 hypothetical protein BTA51_11450 [Hahella sp. CCB-MM4]
MVSELHQTQVDLDGLLDVLGKNLYSTPFVAVRELIQNAHDACIRRKLEADDIQDFRIRISTDSNTKTLIIEDNGSGLTYEEVKSYLATIGAGYTRLLRQRSNTDEMVGYFGLGFLSAYVVADRVEAWTTSYQTPDKTWHFSSSGGKRFVLQEAQSAADVNSSNVGTKVLLTLKQDFAELSEHPAIFSLIQRYCCLLPIPILVNGSETPVNNVLAPWLLDESASQLQQKKKQLEFANIFEDSFEPLCTFPIPENNQYDLKGLIWVQGGSGYSTSDFRNVSIFIRGMFISNECRDLLPRWAGFIGCVLESEQLVPTASREDIQKNDHYFLVQEYLKDILINGLCDIAKNESANWRRVLSRHNQALLGAGVSDDSLFEVIHNDLKVPTSMGDMTLPAYLKQSGGGLYVRNEDKNSHEEILFRAQLKPLVLGYLFAALGFCQKFGERNNVKVHIIGIGNNKNDLFQEISVNSDHHAKLARLFEGNNEKLICTKFSPAFIPMVIIDDQETLLKKRVEKDDADKRIGRAALSLARLHTQNISQDIERRVYINMDSPLISRLIEMGESLSEHFSNTIRSYMESLSHQTDSEESVFSDKLQKFSDSLIALTEKDAL